jgi:hypothetical protein
MGYPSMWSYERPAVGSIGRQRYLRSRAEFYEKLLIINVVVPPKVGLQLQRTIIADSNCIALHSLIYLASIFNFFIFELAASS